MYLARGLQPHRAPMKSARRLKTCPTSYPPSMHRRYWTFTYAVLEVIPPALNLSGTSTSIWSRTGHDPSGDRGVLISVIRYPEETGIPYGAIRNRR